MNSNSIPSSNPTSAGADGLYDANATAAPTPLKAQLGEYLDRETRESLQAPRASATSLRDLARRNAVPVAVALGGAALLTGWLMRRARR